MKLSLSQVREHNRALRQDPDGKYDENDVRTYIEENFSEFVTGVQETRRGTANDERGNKLPPRDISFTQAVKAHYGCELDVFYRQLGIYTADQTLVTVARQFGLDNLNKSTLEDILTRQSYVGSTPANTKQVAPDARFIIAEIMTNAIRTSYLAAAMSSNWIGTTQNMATDQLTMPRIERGDGSPSRVNEAAAIPKGSLRFGKKEVTVFKVGTGFDITDELIIRSTIDMMFEFLQEVGNDMSIMKDVEAMRVLISGDQDDLSESAPVVGVADTSKGYQYKDLKRVFTRMQRLKTPATRIITGEDDGVDITAIDKFEGYQGGDRLSTIRSIIGVPEQFDNDVHVLPNGQILFLNPTRAMAELRHRGLMVERQRNKQTQVEEMYVSDFVGFAIIKRDARVLLDKTISYATNPFPDYMDIDERINEAFTID